MVPKKSGKISRLEPEGIELLKDYPEISQNFRYAGDRGCEKVSVKVAASNRWEKLHFDVKIKKEIGG
jgi:hypothetical protein